MRRLRLFVLAFAFLFCCGPKNPVSPPVVSDELCYGDSVCVRLSLEKKADTVQSGRSVLELTVSFRNSVSRPLTLDSIPSETYIEIVQDTTGEPLIFRSPPSIQDPSPHVRILAAGDSLRFRDVWRFIDLNLNPVVPGRYTIRARILGKAARELDYTVL
ncbi:MAG: hypothetical protein V1913_14405 [Fibrobacterota bacterium]